MRIDIDRLHARDRSYLEGLVRKLSPLIRAAIRRYARDEDHADDLLQECWIHVLDRLDNYRHNDSFAAWAITVSQNFCKRAWRQRKRKRAGMKPVSLELLGDVADPHPDPETTLQLRCQRDILNTVLARLPDRERDVFVLRILEGLSSAEVAVIVGVGTRSVQDILYRATCRLRRMPEVRKLLVEWMEQE